MKSQRKRKSCCKVEAVMISVKEVELAIGVWLKILSSGIEGYLHSGNYMKNAAQSLILNKNIMKKPA